MFTVKITLIMLYNITQLTVRINVKKVVFFRNKYEEIRNQIKRATLFL